MVNGCLEVYTEFEGNEFVIEKLKVGSILNYRNVFTDDKMLVSVRSHENGNGTNVMSLSQESIRAMIIEFPDFGKKF